MTNREIQELDTLIEETNHERLSFLYRKLRRNYNRYFINLKVEVGSKDTLLKEEEKTNEKLRKKIAQMEKDIVELREINYNQKLKIKGLEKRRKK